MRLTNVDVSKDELMNLDLLTSKSLVLFWRLWKGEMCGVLKEVLAFESWSSN